MITEYVTKKRANVDSAAQYIDSVLQMIKLGLDHDSKVAAVTNRLYSMEAKETTVVTW